MRFFLLLLVSFFFRQEVYEVSNPCEFFVNGTSNLHDWNLKCARANGRGAILLENGKVKEIASLDISLLSVDLKSGDKLLEKNAHKSLKASSFPAIDFSLQKVNEIKYVDGICHVSASGFLTIAGTRKSFPLSAQVTVADASIRFEGEAVIKLSDFNIIPPTALFGSVHAGNIINVKFNVKYAPNNIHSFKTG